MQKYICECGRDFDNPQSFNGHKSHCIVHHSKKGTLKKVIAADIKRHTNAKQTFADNHIKLTQQKIELNEINLRQ